MAEVATLIELVRGDYHEIIVGDLRDETGAPATFAGSDVLRWTAKRNRGDPDSAALLRKSSTGSPGGIVFTPGTNTAKVRIFPSDFASLDGDLDKVFFWDCQLAPAGNAAQIVTLSEGVGVIRPDVTRTTP